MVVSVDASTADQTLLTPSTAARTVFYQKRHARGHGIRPVRGR